MGDEGGPATAILRYEIDLVRCDVAPASSLDVVEGGSESDSVIGARWHSRIINCC